MSVKCIYTGFKGEITEGKFYEVYQFGELAGFSRIIIKNNFGKIESYPSRCFDLGALQNER